MSRAVLPEKLQIQFNTNIYSSIPKKGVSKQILESVEDPGLATQRLSASWVLGAWILADATRLTPSETRDGV